MSNNLLLKERNMLSIIRVIKHKKVITKPEIVKITGLAQSTVHNFINELQKKNIVIEDSIADSTGGRKANIYRFNEKIFYVVAVDVGDSYLSACVFDLDLNEIYKTEQSYILHDNSVEDGIEKIIFLIKEIILNSKIDAFQILGIGITVSGPVDFENGKIYQITDAPKWKNIPLSLIIKDKIGIDTIIDKDNNSAALYYKTIYAFKEKQNLVFLCTRKGIGTGALIDGNIYRGKHCLAGELGHIRIDPFGEVCKCGKIGCIEAFTSDPSIVNHALKIIKEGNKTLITELCDKNLSNITLQTIIKAAKNNDTVAMNIFKNTADYLSIAIGNVIKIYDPDEIILDCVWLKSFNKIFNYVANKVYEENEFIDRDRLKIILNKEDDILLYGAATLIIDHHLNNQAESKFIN